MNIISWLKGRWLSRKQLHNQNDPVNKVVTVIATKIENVANAEEAAVVSSVVVKEIQKL